MTTVETTCLPNRFHARSSSFCSCDWSRYFAWFTDQFGGLYDSWVTVALFIVTWEHHEPNAWQFYGHGPRSTSRGRRRLVSTVPQPGGMPWHFRQVAELLAKWTFERREYQLQFNEEQESFEEGCDSYELNTYACDQLLSTPGQGMHDQVLSGSGHFSSMTTWSSASALTLWWWNAYEEDQIFTWQTFVVSSAYLLL